MVSPSNITGRDSNVSALRIYGCNIHLFLKLKNRMFQYSPHFLKLEKLNYDFNEQGGKSMGVWLEKLGFGILPEKVGPFRRHTSSLIPPCWTTEDR